MIKSKLRRRLRKKLHLGEFQEMGFEVFVNLAKNTDEKEFDKFLEDFIEEIEKNKLLFGGGGNGDVWNGFVTSEKKFSSPTIDDIKKIRSWLENRSEVKDCKVGDFLDAWNDLKWNSE